VVQVGEDAQVGPREHDIVLVAGDHRCGRVNVVVLLIRSATCFWVTPIPLLVSTHLRSLARRAPSRQLGTGPSTSPCSSGTWRSSRHGVQSLNDSPGGGSLSVPPDAVSQPW
jgi:hypothetical protein